MIILDGSKNFLKGNLHLHTTLSDGVKTAEEARAVYREHGYDFIAVTDHRKITTDTVTEDGLLSISGVELDFNLSNQLLHLVCIGADKGVMEKLPYGCSCQRAIIEMHKAGAVVFLAHPAWSLNTPEVINSLRGLDGAEIYNTVSGMPINGDRADSSCILDVAFTHGRLLNLIAADDTHFYVGEQCRSYTMVAAEENSEEAVIRALRKGDFYASQGPEFHRIEMEDNKIKVWCSPVKYVCFLSDVPWEKGRTVAGDGLTYAEFTPRTDVSHRFFRIMLADESGKRAWSNPFESLETI